MFKVCIKNKFHPELLLLFSPENVSSPPPPSAASSPLVQVDDPVVVQHLPQPSLQLKVVVGVELQRPPHGVVVMIGEGSVVLGDEAESRDLQDRRTNRMSLSH